MSAYSAILINPFKASCTSVEIERGDNELKQIYALLECSTIETASPEFGERGDRIIVDEEGLFKEDQAFFYAGGMRFAGKALYVGSRGGLFASPGINIEEVTRQVTFKADAFELWIESFMYEKNISVEQTFEYDTREGFACVSVGSILDHIRVSNDNVKDVVKERLVYLDVLGGDVTHFFRFLGEWIVKAQTSAWGVECQS